MPVSRMRRKDARRDRRVGRGAFGLLMVACIAILATGGQNPVAAEMRTHSIARAKDAQSRPSRVRSLGRMPSTLSAGCETASKIEAGFMPIYSVAQAKDHLSKLIDEALAGEEVTITRHGKPVVELRPARAAGDAGRWSSELIDEIAARAKSLPSLEESAADIVRRMRDEYP
jgi:prevent-host-death family protein